MRELKERQSRIGDKISDECMNVNNDYFHGRLQYVSSKKSKQRKSLFY